MPNATEENLTDLALERWQARGVRLVAPGAPTGLGDRAVDDLGGADHLAELVLVAGQAQARGLFVKLVLVV